MRKTIIICSTILDFKDARKILKDTLVSAGYLVLISEDGSIVTDSSKDVYENCLKAVEAADIVIVLIGSRYGTLFDEKRRISITREEYRHAKRLNKDRLVFIDKATWNAKPLYKSYIDKGFGFIKSPAVEEVEVLDFIDEVEESGDWIHEFSDVVDLIKTVKNQLNIVDPQYELYFQPKKGNPSNPDGTLNFEIGFKNISGVPLFEFLVQLVFKDPIINIEYNFSRSNVNLTGGEGLSTDKTRFEWLGQMLPTDGWIVFNIVSSQMPVIGSMITKHHGKVVSSGAIIRGLG